MTAPVSIIDPAHFRRACSRFATGITVCTVCGKDGTPYGLTANSFTSVSCCPPLVLICVDHRSSLIPIFRDSPYFGVNILAAGQKHLSVRFSQQPEDRFRGIDWNRSAAGVPILAGVLASFECLATQMVDAGDHTIFIGEVVRAEYGEGKPLIYYGSSYHSVSEQSFESD